MIKAFSWIAVLLVLSGLTASAQLSPTLQVTNTTTGFAALSWSNTPSYFGFILQSTTNLSRPITWNQRSAILGNSITNFWMPIANAQEFFRLAAPVPIFSFAIFYNLNMEIDPGSAMTISGPVYSNQGIWASAFSAGLVFSSTVQAVNQINTSANDPFANDYFSGGITPTFSLAGQPVSGVGALNLLNSTNINPANVEAILQLPPSAYAMGTAAAYSTNGQAYLANAVDLIISNSPSGTNSLTPKGTNIFVYFQDSSAAQFLTQVPPDFYKLKTGESTNFVSTNLAAGKYSITNVQYASYSFLTNVLFYDWREGWNGGSGIGGKGKAVQAVQIDIAKFSNWLLVYPPGAGMSYNNLKFFHSGHPIDSVYIYNSVPLTSTTLPAVRVVNGQQLPEFYAFTIATPQPLYMLGNYNVQTNGGSPVLGSSNTASTYPAALMADAMTALSTNWNDNLTTTNPIAGSTTINAAILTGIVPSNPAIDGNYSGGVENFMRLLENWSGMTLTYNGSIVAMFPSQYATNSWQPSGDYYYYATRHWAFDTNFTQASKLPPLTPMVINFVSP